ncbi:hypothetical protein ACH4MO_20030 [Streptomyces globisporus]|uniref:hypothetical protein n=1 Tax=Streptomyces globisporus TaxID=1908 RepID=UPI0037B3C5F9
MSRPPTFAPPPCARARVLATERGDFAVLDAVPRTPARATRPAGAASVTATES